MRIALVIRHHNTPKYAANIARRLSGFDRLAQLPLNAPAEATRKGVLPALQTRFPG